ncbi:MAG TPA: glycine zipper 2TM domain-containing protein [Oleiagrimonas sp.]|nr:glycine zipper 2TM domain-containing protein [Oleiagrimonas sp.]
MNKYLKGTMWVGFCALTTIGLAACNQSATASGPQYADVVSATPIKKTVNHPQKKCHMEAVTVHKPVKDEHQILGTAIGAVAGGLIGNQIGGGDGKKLATVAGAVAGGYAGNKIQENHQENATKTVNRQVCNTVDNKSTKIVGYTVKYKVNGTVHTTRMDHDPGARVEIKQGVSVVGTAK